MGAGLIAAAPVNKSGEYSFFLICNSNLFISMYLLIFPSNQRFPADCAEAVGDV